MKKATKKTKNVTHVTFIIDESGSMAGLQKDVLSQYKGQLDALKEQKQLTGEEFLVTIVSFNDRVRTIVPETNIDDAEFTDYNPGGSTALRDAICNVGFTAWDNSAGHAYLVFVMTDGQENISVTSEETTIKLIKDLNATDKWTFIALVPMGNKHYMTKLGFYPGNVKEWEVTRGAAGLYAGTQSVSASYAGYTTMRSTGVTATKSFFETDMSVVNKTFLKQQADVSKDYKILKVDKEIDIKAFVEAKRYKYYPGRALYQLTKTEELQYGKDIVIEDKKTGKIYNNGRELLGLPQQNIKVQPGNHETYNIYVRSTSLNRKLVRGTNLLLEK